MNLSNIFLILIPTDRSEPFLATAVLGFLIPPTHSLFSISILAFFEITFAFNCTPVIPSKQRVLGIAIRSSLATGAPESSVLALPSDAAESKFMTAAVSARIRPESSANGSKNTGELLEVVELAAVRVVGVLLDDEELDVVGTAVQEGAEVAGAPTTSSPESSHTC